MKCGVLFHSIILKVVKISSYQTRTLSLVLAIASALSLVLAHSLNLVAGVSP